MGRHIGKSICTTPTVYLPQGAVPQSLVECGANGGIGGSYVCVIYKTNDSMGVLGINNHQMVDRTISTVGGVMNTKHLLPFCTSMPTLVLALQSTHHPNWSGTRMILMIAL